MTVELVTVFPERFDVNGDRGNVLTLRRRLEWAGFDVSVIELALGDPWPSSAPDLLHVGGGTVAAQRSALPALRRQRERVHDWIGSGMPYLAIGGGLQVSAARLRLPGDEHEEEGLGVFDAVSRPTGSFRSGYLVGRTAEWGTLFGYEHLSQSLELSAAQLPLSRVVTGSGNVFTPGTDGAVAGTAYGSHAHGPLLPKNPRLADHLIGLMLAQGGGGDYRYGERHRAADEYAERGRAVLRARLKLAPRVPRTDATFGSEAEGLAVERE